MSLTTFWNLRRQTHMEAIIYDPRQRGSPRNRDVTKMQRGILNYILRSEQVALRLSNRRGTGMLGKMRRLFSQKSV